MGSSSNSNANGNSTAEEEAPPPYEEAVKSSAIPQATTGSSSTTRPAASRPAASRPQQQFHSSTQSYTQSHTQNYSHSYSHSPAPPPGPTAPPTSGGLPFKYPKGFHCRKCDNTGYKLKNGKTCKDCWEKFSPRNSTNSVNYNFHPQHFGSTTFIPYGSAPVPNPHPGGRAGGSGGFFSTAPMVPLRVPPGDPRLGGVLCGRCRGSGMVRFLLDMELCPVCSGLGRVVNMPAGHSSHAPPPQTQAHNPYYGDRKR